MRTPSKTATGLCGLCWIVTACLALTLCAGCSKDDKQQQQSGVSAPEGPVRANVDTVGTKGKDRSGYLSTVVAEKYRFEDRLNLQVLNYNLKLYKATNGRYPDDFEQLTSEVIVPYQVEMPELPDGAHYEYDPNDGQFGTLWVVPDGKTFRDTGGQ